MNFDQFLKPKHNQQHVGERVVDLLDWELKSILPFSIPPEQLFVLVGEDLQSLAWLRKGFARLMLARRMEEDILNARGTDEVVVENNIQNKFRDKDFYWMHIAKQCSYHGELTGADFRAKW